MKGAEWDPAVVKLLRSVFGRQQEHLFWGVGLFILALIAQITERFLKPPPEDNLAFGPQGGGIQKGTLEDFLQEITDSANEIVREAKNSFEDALNELSKGEFRTAARDFWRSVKNVPTMSGYLNLGVSQYFCAEWLKAKNSFQSGLEIASRVKHELFEARFINNLGLLELHMGNLSDARRDFERARRLFKQYGNEEGEAATAGNLGDIAYLIGHYGEAQDLQQKAIEGFRGINHRTGEAYAQMALGTVFAAQGKVFEARACYDVAYRIFKAINNRIGLAHALGNQASTWTKTGNFAKALKLHNQALKLDRKSGDRVGEAFNLQNIGTVKFQIGEVGEAIEYYDAALKINRDLKNRSGEAECLGNISNIYMTAGNFMDLKKAEEFLRKAHEIYTGMVTWTRQRQSSLTWVSFIIGEVNLRNREKYQRKHWLIRRRLAIWTGKLLFLSI
jgi:tetratricopeptide (TPR) repeat protein